MTEIIQAEGQPKDNHLNVDNSGSRWIRIGLFSLLIVTILVCAARLLSAQSHTPYVAWLTQIVMILMVQYLAQRSENPFVWKKYNWLLWTNLLSAVGLVISFGLLMKGYGIVFVIFLILSTFVSYAFTVMYWLDLNRLPKRLIAHLWFKAALIWNVISSIGTFTFTYILVAHISNDVRLKAATCFFQHFQYNGWLLFACGGLLYSSNIGDTKMSRNVFYTLLLSCGPAYFISVLWADLPTGTYIIAALAALAQLFGWITLLSQVARGGINLINNLRPEVRILMIIAVVAGSLNYLWQLGSLHPAIARLAAGVHPFEVAYRQLILHCLLTNFVIAYLIQTGSIAPGGWRKKGIIIFVAAMILEEIILLGRGIAENNQSGGLSWINQLLLVCDLIMIAGIALLNVGLAKVKSEK